MYKQLFVPLLLSPCCLFSQLTITPKLGLQLCGFSSYEKGVEPREDLRLSVPDPEVYVGVEANVYAKKYKLSVGLEFNNLGESFTIKNDSSVYDNGRVGTKHNSESGSHTHILLYTYYDRIYNYLGESKRFSFFYGVGAGIGFNRTDAFYRETQGALYSATYWGGENYTYIEIYHTPSGTGYFLKLRGGLAFHKKNGQEKLLLEMYYNKGFKTMLKHSLNYEYGHAPSQTNIHKVTDLRFNGRGTTLGVNLCMPIYLSK